MEEETASSTFVPEARKTMEGEESERSGKTLKSLICNPPKTHNPVQQTPTDLEHGSGRLFLQISRHSSFV